MSRAVGKILTIKDYICELHFLPECIVAKDTTILPNGSLHCLARQRLRLINEAIPMVLANQDNIEETVESSLLQQEEMVHIEQSTSANDLNLLFFDNSCNNPERDEIIRNVATEDRGSVEAAHFSIRDVVQYFNTTPLRQAWSWLQKEDFIILTQVDKFSQKIRLTAKIYSDLSVTIYTSDDKIAVDLHGTITSNKKIDKLLDCMEKKTYVCSGTGIEKKVVQILVQDFYR